MGPIALVGCIVLALLVFRFVTRSAAREAAPRRPAGLPPVHEHPHIWTRGSWSVDFHEMTATLRNDADPFATEVPLIGFLVRRVSAVEWQTKLHPKWVEARIAKLQEILDRPAPAGEDEHERQEREADQAVARDELNELRSEATWRSTSLPEELVAPLETAYQRYLVR